MKRNLIYLILLTVFFACQQNKTNLRPKLAIEVLELNGTFADKTKQGEFQNQKTASTAHLWTLKKGYDYKRFSTQASVSNNLGNIATYHIEQAKNGQRLFSSYEKNSPLEMWLKNGNSQNPIQLALLAMHPGDSIAIDLPSDYWESLPKGFSEGDKMGIYIKMLGLKGEAERRAQQVLSTKKSETYPSRIAQELLPLDREELTPLDRGVKRLTIQEGKGNIILNGSKVRLDYIGMVETGTVFRNTLEEKIAREFVQGEDNMILGWNIGCQGMREGGKYLFFAPAETAYGASENEQYQIPANSDLVFYVEVLKVNNN